MSNHTSDDKSKTYPAMTPEVAKLLGLPVNSASKPAEPRLGGAAGDGLMRADHGAFSAPQAAHGEAAHAASHDDHHSAASGHGNHGFGEHAAMVLGEDSSSASNVIKALKAITPYVVVFSVALIVYFYFFGSPSFNLNLSRVFARQAKVQTPKENLLEQLQKQNVTAYQNWISQFYYDVSDPKILDPQADNSGNGLTNFQKFLLNLNPKSYDTLGLGMADSEALAQGINPLSGSPLTEEQKAIVDKYFDLEVISNRLALSHLQKSGEVAGATSFANDGGGARTDGTTGTTAGTTQPAYQVSTDMIGGSQVKIATGTPGRLEIPSLNVDAPVIWSTDPKKFDVDLQSGVIHYPGTAMPGQIGTAYISGHSSNYAWAKGSYNQVFTHLNELADNTSFRITVKTTDGKTVVLHYVVAGRQEYDPKDQAQFRNGSKSVVALSTCWPVGSTKSRLVVFGELAQVENQ